MSICNCCYSDRYLLLHVSVHLLLHVRVHLLLHVSVHLLTHKERCSPLMWTCCSSGFASSVHVCVQNLFHLNVQLFLHVSVPLLPHILVQRLHIYVHLMLHWRYSFMCVHSWVYSCFFTFPCPIWFILTL